MPVLLCTAFSDDFRDDEISAAGVQAVLRKPLDPGQLHACLARLLSTPTRYPNETLGVRLDP